MKNKSEAQKLANKIFKDLKKKSLGRKDFFIMYTLGKYIEFCLEGFEVVVVKDTTTRFSNCYLHLVKDKKEFILSEEVAQAFSACLRYVDSCREELGGKTADLLMSCIDAEFVLNSFISLYESIESISTKEQVVEKLSLRVDQFLEDMHEAYDLKLKMVTVAFVEAFETYGIDKAVEVGIPSITNFPQHLIVLERDSSVNC